MLLQMVVLTLTLSVMVGNMIHIQHQLLWQLLIKGVRAVQLLNKLLLAWWFIHWMCIWIMTMTTLIT